MSLKETLHGSDGRAPPFTIAIIVINRELFLSAQDILHLFVSYTANNTDPIFLLEWTAEPT